MALGEARIEIVPDVSGFEKALTSAVESAMASAKGAADDAATEIAGSFDSAATEAEASLSGVDGAGFAEASAAADSASAEVSGAFDAASSEADAALSSVDGDGFSEAVGAAEQAGGEITQTMETAASDTQRAFERLDLGKTLQGAFAGAAVLGFTKSILDAAEAGEKARARVDQIAESMNLFGGNVTQVTDRLGALADATARQTGVDDDSILATQAKLLTFRELAATADEVGGAFDRATVAAIDLAAAGFGSAESNAVQLGKALQDPIKGITALARAGVTFTESEKERIRVLVESNQIGEAQNLILQALETQVGGTAAATATASEKMRVSFDQAAEAAGQALLPAMQMIAETVGALAGAFLSLPEPLQKIVTLSGLAAAGFYAASRALQGLGLAASTANKSLGVIGVVLGVAVKLYDDYASAKRQAEEVTQDFVDALAAERSGQEGATRAAILAQITNDEYLKTYRDLGLTAGEVALAIEGKSVPAIERLNEILAMGRNGTLDYSEITKVLGDEFNTTLNGASNFATSLDNLTGQMSLAIIEEKELAEAQRSAAALALYGADITDKQANALSIYSGAAGSASAATDDMTLSLEEQQLAADAAEQALWDLLNATLAQFNSELALEGQITRVNDALGAYSQAQIDATTGKLKGEEAARAIADAERNAAEQALSMAASAARLAEDQAAASGATLTAAESARIQRDNLAIVAASLDPNSPLRKRLQGYIDELENQIPRDIQTNLEARVNISGNALQFVRTGQISRTAEGGVFSLPQTRLIAEAGSEAVIPITRPARAMELLETSGLADLVRSQGGGPAVMIQSATFADATDADLVAQRVNTALRIRAFAG
jgi:hypothetical protein